MRKYFKIVVITLLSIPLYMTSCNNWLDVKPEDKTLEEDMFRSETNIHKALNAIYHKLASKDLYGQQLTKSTVDVLAQYYNSTARTQSGTNRYEQLLKYQYATSESQAYFEGIWQSGYTVILSINNFLEGLQKYQVSLSAEKKTLLEGEALALRALVHLDLLRLYGPIVSSNSQDQAIPYRATTQVDLSPLLSAEAVLDQVLADLELAEAKLQKDPIITQGPGKHNAYEGDFYQNRNRRMNYYAVQALQARAKLYKGDKEGARQAAAKVITGATTWFPWQGEQEHLGINANRIFYSEVLFGLEDIDTYTNFKELFESSLNDDNLLAPAKSPNVALDVYENNAQDFRYIANWGDLTASQSATRPFGKLLIKYADTDSKNQAWRNFQPLLRISEMYYILAEVTGETSYLNEVREHRGLEPLGKPVVEAGDLLNAYRKEFIGEGQLFFFYKRTAQPSIKGFNLEQIPMNAATYCVPLPLSETNQRK